MRGGGDALVGVVLLVFLGSVERRGSCVVMLGGGRRPDGQAGAGSAFRRLKALRIAPVQGQSAGRCRVVRRAWRVICPATCRMR